MSGHTGPTNSHTMTRGAMPAQMDYSMGKSQVSLREQSYSMVYYKNRAGAKWGCSISHAFACGELTWERWAPARLLAAPITSRAGAQRSQGGSEKGVSGTIQGCVQGRSSTWFVKRGSDAKDRVA